MAIPGKNTQPTKTEYEVIKDSESKISYQCCSNSKESTLHLPESWVRVVLDELRGIFNPHFFDECTAVSEGADLEVDEVVFVRPLRVLQGHIATSTFV